MIKNLDSFKLAGLRAGALVDAAAQDSSLVRGAMKFNLWRKATKLRLRRLFKKATPPTGALKVLVHIKGGIGDVVMSRVLVKKLREILPQAELYFAYDHKPVVDMVFSDGLISGFVSTKYLPENFDLVIAGCHFLMFEHYNRGRLEKLAPQFMPAFEQGLAVQACFKPFAMYTPYLDGQLAAITVENGGDRVANQGWFTGLEINQNDEEPLALSPEKSTEVLNRLGLVGKKYITIHDGINTNTDTSHGHPTRCWPERHWREFVQLFKTAHPDVSIAQLGGAKSHVFDFVDISLVGKTSVADLPYVLAGALLHVDGESGMVHIAHLTPTNSVVLFGPTPVKYFGYSRNTNIAAPFCGGCMNITKHWMTQCVLGYPLEKQCLAAITPTQVLEAVKNRLS